MFIRLSRAASIMVILITCTMASAQDFRATISGTVKDPNGASVPGATIKAINVETNQSYETRTTSDGFYTLPFVNPGTYNIEVKADGFKLTKFDHVTVRVADKLNLPLAITVGAVTDLVTVTADQEVIESGSADRGLVFSPTKVSELPLNGRQVFMLLGLTPGVLFTQETFGATGFSGTRGWDVNNSLRINGARAGQNLFLMNGAPISNSEGTWQIAPNVEAVQEFKVMTNTYDAGYGRFGGGVVNITMKTGGNKWHGSLFEFWRNRILDANFFQNNAAGKPKTFHNQHNFGGAIGGPIRKDKDFLFASWDGWQEVVPFPVTSSTPPIEIRGGNFNGIQISGNNIKIYDPLTTRPCNTADCKSKGVSYIRDQFPNNIIPMDRLSEVGKKILSYYPSPNIAGRLNQNFIGSNVGRYYYNQPLVKWDHVFNENNKMFINWTYQKGYEFRDGTGFGKPAANGNTDNERRFVGLNIGYTKVLSPNSVFDSRLSLMRFTQITPGYSDPTLTASSFGMTQLVKSPTNNVDIVPQINIDNFTRLFSSGNRLSRTPFTQINFTPSLSITRGKQTWKTGFEFNYQARGNMDSGVTSLNFNSGWTTQHTGYRANDYDGSSIASLLLGMPASGSTDWNETYYRTRPYYAGYFQNDWKTHPRLNLNLGLRYEVQIPWKERFNRTNRGFDLTKKHPLSDQAIANWNKVKTQWDAANPTAKYKYPDAPSAIYGVYEFPGKGGNSARMFDTDFTNLAPRIGIAWRMFGNTVLRTGGGVYYQSSTQFNTTTGFSQSTPYIASLDGNITPSMKLTGPYSLVNPFPNGLLAPPGASVMAGIGGGISYDSPSFRVPRTYQFSFGFQQQIGRNIVAEASYALNIQKYITISQDDNHPGLENQKRAIQDPIYFDRSLPNPFLGLLPVTTSLGSAKDVPAFDLLRPYPIYRGGVTNNTVPAGRYRSDQLQIRVEQKEIGGSRGSAGVLTWNLSYTLAKSFEANHRLNNWNITGEPIIYELDNTDKPHVLAINGVWDLPFGKDRAFLNQNRFGRTLLGNWRMSWIFSYTSGNPLGQPNIKNKCGEDWQATYGGGLKSDDRWFNNTRSCYENYPRHTIRTTPDRFSNIRDHQAPQLNASLEKTFNITESKRFLIRAEGFNLTNTPIRSGVSGSFGDTQNFGKVDKSQRNFPRFFQLAAKFSF